MHVYIYIYREKDILINTCKQIREQEDKAMDNTTSYLHFNSIFELIAIKEQCINILTNG